MVLGQVAKGVQRRRPARRHGDAARDRHALPRRRPRVPRVRVGTCRTRSGDDAVSADRDVAILGVGMHPWGKWGRDFTEYGMVAARGRARRRRPRLARHPVRRRGRHHPQRLPGVHRRRDVRPEAGLDRRARLVELRRVRVGRAGAAPGARADPRRASATSRLVIGADTTPKGFFAPVGGERRNDPDWLRFHLLGATNPVYFALYARRRMDVYGATSRRLRARQGEELAATGSRTRTRASARRTRSTTSLNSPVVADPLRLLDICATSDGAAAMIVSSMDFAAHAPRLAPTACRGSRRSPPSRRATRRPCSSCPTSPPTRARCVPAARPRVQGLDRGHGVRGGGHRARRPQPGRGLRPLHRARARLVREHRAVRRGRGRGAAALGRRPTIGGRIPVNPSGGLACFGEAIPAQAIAQVCEVTWQLRGQAGGRQVEGATVGITANQGSVRSRVVRDRQQRSDAHRDARRTAMAEAYIVDAVRTPGRAARRRPVAGPPRRPRRALDQGARSSAPASTPARSTTSCSAASTRIGPQAGDIARTCWLVAGLPRGGARAPPSTASAARRSRPCTSPRRA